MDYKTIELAAKLTEKAMGSDAASTNWIGHHDKVVQFLNAAAKALNDLLYEPAPGSRR